MGCFVCACFVGILFLSIYTLIVDLFCAFMQFRWERRVDNRGRVYYVDHNTRTTTWQRPSMDFMQNVQNWQQQWNNNRSQAFEQLQNRTLFNSTMMPSTTPQEDSFGALPEGWGTYLYACLDQNIIVTPVIGGWMASTIVFYSLKQFQFNIHKHFYQEFYWINGRIALGTLCP